MCIINLHCQRTLHHTYPEYFPDFIFLSVTQTMQLYSPNSIDASLAHEIEGILSQNKFTSSVVFLMTFSSLHLKVDLVCVQHHSTSTYL